MTRYQEGIIKKTRETNYGICKMKSKYYISRRSGGIDIIKQGRYDTSLSSES
jgi:hypothetical protein